MPRLCTVCSHAARSEIDAALVTQTHRAVAKQFQIGESAVYRHKIACLVSAMAKTSKIVPTRGETIAEAPEVMEVARADRLVDHVEALRGRAMRFLDELESLAAQDDGEEARPTGRGMDYRAAALMLKEARECLGLQARLLGEMQATGPIGLMDDFMKIVLASIEDPEQRDKVVASAQAWVERRRASK